MLVSNTVIPTIALAAAVNAQLSLPLTRRSTGLQKRGVDRALKAASALRNKYPSHSSRSRTKKRASSANIALTDESIDTTYFAEVDIGTPSQKFGVILDTGSSDLWVIATASSDSTGSSTGCSTFDPFCSGSSGSSTSSDVTTFNSSKSSTFKDLGQQLAISYGSGDVSGTTGSDTVTFGGLKASTQTFGLITNDQANVADSNISGLMGLAFRALAQTQSPPVWETLYNASALSSPMMGFSLNRNKDSVTSDTQTSDGGTFTLGGTDTSLYTGDIEYTDVTEAAYWSISIASLSANGNAASLGTSAVAAIDSGSTLIGGPQAVLEQIYASIGGSAGTGADLEGTGLYVYPCNTTVEIKVSFGQSTWTVSSDDFMFEQYSDTECIGAMMDVDLTGSGLDWILGDAFMKNVYTVFRWEPASVGFAAKSASSSSSSSSGNSSNSSGSSSGSNGASSLTLSAPFTTLALASVLAGVLFAA